MNCLELLYGSTKNFIALSTCFSTFLDVDECVALTHNCSENANCTNLVGSFNCSCNPGYVGNGTTCTGNVAHNFTMEICLNNYIISLIKV